MAQLAPYTPAEIEAAAAILDQAVDQIRQGKEYAGILAAPAPHDIRGLAFAAYRLAASPPEGSPFAKTYRYADAADLLRARLILGTR